MKLKRTERLGETLIFSKGQVLHVQIGPQIDMKVTLIATVSPSTCTGTVTFYDASAPSSSSLISLQPTTPAYGTVIAESGALGTVTLDRGRALFSTAALIVGNHPINVKYSGDGKCAPFGYAAANDFQYRTISQTVVPQFDGQL